MIYVGLHLLLLTTFVLPYDIFNMHCTVHKISCDLHEQLVRIAIYIHFNMSELSCCEFLTMNYQCRMEKEQRMSSDVIFCVCVCEREAQRGREKGIDKN